MEPIRILIIDDHDPMRRLMRTLVSSRPEMAVCGEAADGLDAVEKVERLHPDVVLMDISMRGMDGLEATRIIHRKAPNTAVILVTQNEHEVVRRLAESVHASGFVLKSSLAHDLIPTVQRAVEEESVETPIRVSAVIDRSLDAAGAPANPVSQTQLPPFDSDQGPNATALLAAIVDSSDDAIVSKSLEGVITSWNKGAERMFGYTADEAVGRNITIIIPEERHREEMDILARLRRGERIDHYETVRMHKDGTLLDISLTVSPVKDATGRIVGASKVARDITDRKRAEEALRRSEDRFRELTTKLESEVRARTHELEERNTDLRELSWRLMQIQDAERRHIARELHDSAGQTLAVLGMSLAHLTQRVNESAPQLKPYADEVQQFLQQLTQEIRTASYLLHPPLLDESGLAAALAWYVRGLAERSGLEIRLNMPENLGRLSPDVELLIFRLVQEALTNIHRHSGSKTAEIRIVSQPGRVHLEISDEGRGIPPERLRELEAQGSGVGIRGMRERVRRFGGDMKIASGPAGTTLSFRVPTSEAQITENSEAKRAQAS